jgi:hypothetical protein
MAVCYLSHICGQIESNKPEQELPGFLNLLLTLFRWIVTTMINTGDY